MSQKSMLLTSQSDVLISSWGGGREGEGHIFEGPGFPKNGVDTCARLGNVVHVHSARAHFPKALVKLLFVAVICLCGGSDSPALGPSEHSLASLYMCPRVCLSAVLRQSPNPVPRKSEMGVRTMCDSDRARVDPACVSG